MAIAAEMNAETQKHLKRLPLKFRYETSCVIKIFGIFLSGSFTGSGPEMNINWHVDNYFLTFSTRWSYRFDNDIHKRVKKSAQLLNGTDSVLISLRNRASFICYELLVGPDSFGPDQIELVVHWQWIRLGTGRMDQFRWPSFNWIQSVYVGKFHLLKSSLVQLWMFRVAFLSRGKREG